MSGIDHNKDFLFAEPPLPGPDEPIPLDQRPAREARFAADDPLPPDEPFARPTGAPRQLATADLPAIGLTAAAEQGGRAWPEPRPIQAADIHGPLHAFCGKVLKTWYASAHPTTGRVQDIDVEIADVAWNSTTNVPVLFAKPQAFAEPTTAVYTASPWPLREDQPAYHVAAGDAVTVLLNDDGTAWFMADELPFVGKVVQDPDNTDDKESNFGGAGNGLSIAVRRVQFSGDPTADGYTLSDAYTQIFYDYVRVLTSAGQHHGYRIGANVLVVRRGNYFWAVPDRGVYHGYVTSVGPDGEADFADDHYWLALFSAGVDNAGSEVNAWGWHAIADTPLFIVDAANLAEKAAGTHSLPTDDSVEVVATLFLSADSGLAYWVFAATSPTAVEDKLCKNATYSPAYPAGNVDPAWTAITATANGTAGEGDPSDADQMFVTGWSFWDGQHWNPWFVIDVKTTIKNYFDSHGGDVFCTYVGTLDAVDASGSDGTATHFRVDGVMFADDQDPPHWNPRIALDPTKLFCMSDDYSGKSELSGAATYYVKAHHYQEDEAGGYKINPWVPLPIAADETWIHAENVAGVLTISHKTHGPTVVCSFICGIGLDARQHVSEYCDDLGVWHTT